MKHRSSYDGESTRIFSSWKQIGINSNSFKVENENIIDEEDSDVDLDDFPSKKVEEDKFNPEIDEVWVWYTFWV